MFCPSTQREDREECITRCQDNDRMDSNKVGWAYGTLT